MVKFILALNFITYIIGLVIIPNAEIPIYELEAGGISFFQLDMNFIFSALRYIYAIVAILAFGLVGYCLSEKILGNLVLFTFTTINISFIVWFAYKFVI